MKEKNDKKKNAIPRQQIIDKVQKTEKYKPQEIDADIQKLREVIVLSEVIGTPVCKKRRARRL